MSRRRELVMKVAVAILALLAAGALLGASPQSAKANVACDLGSAPAGAITEGVGAITGGAIGGGNPVGDLCNEVADKVTGAVTEPITGAIKDVGNSVFKQLTTWVAQGTSWLMGQVVEAIQSSTTPKLDTKGFLLEYGRMAAIAAILGSAMLLLAILEGIAQGSPGLLLRVVFVNVPLAFIGTSIAFALVQLLIGVTDGLCAAVSSVSHHNSQAFFEQAISDLSHVGAAVGKPAGIAQGEAVTDGAGGEAAGAVAVPLFVAFLAAVVGAIAAILVWLELLMRDAAVYAVSLFLPLSLAASIWPRWSGALRRSGELLIAVIGSKFVIVAIISLAATLVTEESGSVEHVLAAAALMCLACFAPLVLLRLIPFSEGAFAAAYSRRSAGGGAVGAMQIGTDVQMMRRMGHSGEGGSGVSLWSAAEGGGGDGSPPRPSGAEGGGGPGAGSGGNAGGGGAGAGSGAAAGGSGASGGAAAAGGAAGAGAAAASAAASVPVGAAKAARGAGQKLASTGVARASTESGGEGEGSKSGAAPQSTPQPAEEGGKGAATAPPQNPGGQVPRPPSESPKGSSGGPKGKRS